MYVLGLSCFYHDSSAVLLKDGVVVAAAQEERFNRKKYSPDFPIQSINYCLQKAGITTYDLDHIAFYEKMFLKFERTIISHLFGFPWTFRNFVETMPLWLKDRLAVPYVIREELSYKNKISFVYHHHSHAAAAFFTSNFDDSSVLTVDGVGEYATATTGFGNGTELQIEQEIRYPHSLGLLYSIVTSYLGFRVFTGEGKIMALAELGNASYMKEFEQLIDIRKDGSFKLDLSYFSFNRGERMHSKKLEQLLGPSRKENEELIQRHKDIACSLQRTTELALVRMAQTIEQKKRSKNLCLAGGVFLNVTANSKIRQETSFENIHIQPAAGDAGSALGAALYLHHGIHGRPRTPQSLTMALGPEYSDSATEILLKNENLKYEKLNRCEMAEKVARLLQEGKIVGWFQGRMEFGPRALGQRSLLADPRDPQMIERLNSRVKHRESFRPFAASVLRGDVSDFFQEDMDSPYMLYVANVRKERASQIPAVVHGNGTSRIQTVTENDSPFYFQLINEFKKLTGIPMVLNTSFNDDEPIVCTPKDAIHCFQSTEIDHLAIGSFLVNR